ncbi:MAG: hypothetical protein D6824_08785 [Planctomycetota bacterium]|nr:MAG: hypothetical protein D6824_08785 [Planctomycetota bacterium]
MSAISGFSSATPPTTKNGFDAVTSEDFVRIMFSELTNQDPLAPNDTKALLEQIGLIRSIESDIDLSKRLEQIASRSELASAGALLGSFVVGVTAEGESAEGVVGSISVTDEGPILNLLNAKRIPFANVQEFIDPRLLTSDSSQSSPPPSV